MRYLLILLLLCGCSPPNPIKPKAVVPISNPFSAREPLFIDFVNTLYPEASDCSHILSRGAYLSNSFTYMSKLYPSRSIKTSQRSFIRDVLEQYKECKNGL